MTDVALVERVRAHASRLFPEPGLALLAVSGGGDSLALLDLFATLGPELGLTLLVAHADHGIAPGSDAVARTVERQARERYGLETVVGRLALGAGASETRSRAARYGFLRAVQAERGARYLLTAHHADDQVETVVLRVLRGSAPAGLRGIAARGPHGLVRPLLPFFHAELLAHAERAGLEVAQDPANRDPRHLRSWVRTVLLPVVGERMGPAATRALLDVARHAGREMRAWDAVLDTLPGLALRTAEGRFEVAGAVLRGYDNVLAGRILRAAAARAGLRITPASATRLARFAGRAGSGRRLALGDGLTAEVAFDALVVGRMTCRCRAPSRSTRPPARRRSARSRSPGGPNRAPRRRAARRVDDLAGGGEPGGARAPERRRAHAAGRRGPAQGGPAADGGAGAAVPPRGVSGGGERGRREATSCGFQGSLARPRGFPFRAGRRCALTLELASIAKVMGGRAVRRIVYQPETIHRRVEEMGAQITEAYPDGDLLVLGLLKGSFIFLGDLVRQIGRPIQIDFLVAASYGNATVSSGDVRLLYDPATRLDGKHILLVEDIIDTGRTLNRLIELLGKRNPLSLNMCALLHKHIAPNLMLEPRFLGFDAPKEFLVGYGLDHAEDFRHLPFIASLAE